MGGSDGEFVFVCFNFLPSIPSFLSDLFSIELLPVTHRTLCVRPQREQERAAAIPPSRITYRRRRWWVLFFLLFFPLYSLVFYWSFFNWISILSFALSSLSWLTKGMTPCDHHRLLKNCPQKAAMVSLFLFVLFFFPPFLVFNWPFLN